MAIQTATDIILDVVKAADPAVAQRAEAMLEAASARKSERAAATPAFERQLLASSDTSAISVSAASGAAAAGKTIESYERFEAMILQSFIADMLPKDSEQLYGEGTAGEIWKGMMAEQLGAALARGGGIGIAARMAGEGVTISPSQDDNLTNRAASMTNDFQKRILADIAGSDEATDTTAKSSQGHQTA